jgi:hypothetical protein
MIKRFKFKRPKTTSVGVQYPFLTRKISGKYGLKSSVGKFKARKLIPGQKDSGSGSI